jgi:hypothetical protein
LRHPGLKLSPFAAYLLAGELDSSGDTLRKRLCAGLVAIAEQCFASADRILNRAIGEYPQTGAKVYGNLLGQ